MSLILDAIKKSERERQQQGVPDLSSNHEAYQAEVEKKNQWPKLILTMLVLVLIIIITLFSFTNYFSSEKNHIVVSVATTTLQPQTQIIQSTASTVSVVKHSNTEFTQKTTLNPELSKTVVIEPVKINKISLEQETQKVIAHTELPTLPKQATSDNAIANLQQVSASIQQNFQAIEFSSHVFTGDQNTSFVVLNDEMLGVGEALDNGIEVVKISKDGLVIKSNEKQVFLKALQNWQP